MPTSTTVSYTTASNQVSGRSMNNGLALGYDAAGNVTSDGINLHDDRLGTAEFRLSFANRVGQFRLEHLTCRRSWAELRNDRGRISACQMVQVRQSAQSWHRRSHMVGSRIVLPLDRQGVTSPIKDWLWVFVPFP